ncbi:MAG: hypothetical protein ACI9MR_000743, partial [Myxococcota bacterium]
LLLKSFGRCYPKAPATVALTALEIEIVRAMGRIKLPRDPSLKDAMNAVAAMGGTSDETGPLGGKHWPGASKTSRATNAHGRPHARDVINHEAGGMSSTDDAGEASKDQQAEDQVR